MPETTKSGAERVARAQREHAIRRANVRVQGRTSISGSRLVHPQWLVHRLAVTGSRPLVIGGEDNKPPYAF